VIAPARPADLRDSGLGEETVASLVLKWLHRGERTGMDLADAVGLSYAILEPLIEQLRFEQLVEVKRASGAGTAGYRYALTGEGRVRAVRAMARCGYVGVAPVPLEQYAAYMAALSDAHAPVDRTTVAQAFSHLVVQPAMLDQLGPAIAARRAVFLYGPPGNGKSAMGEGIGRALGGDIYIPGAIDVEGQVIALFDPAVHQSRDTVGNGSLIRADDEVDGRWVRIRRPVITVGGELSAEMLELRFDALSAFYEAPVQLKANGGLLLVDDFGRQKVSPRDLLNRWVVPLESRVDYLTLQTGRKFGLPFDAMVVFATNLQPGDLADEAFLRRIPYKVLAKDPTVEQFSRIFEQTCQRHGLAFDPAQVAHLREHCYLGRGIPMRACHPRDLIGQIVSFCRYHQRPVEVTPELLDVVCATYFIDDTPGDGVRAG